MRTKFHMAININGLLKNHKGIEINFFEDGKGNFLSDKEARAEIAEHQAKGHVLMCSDPDNCPDFDYFGKGCPGHPIEENKKL